MSHPVNTPLGLSGGGAYGFVRDGYNQTEIHELTTADVESATVYGRNDETIGSISSLQVGTDGKITDAVIDVGGFLGMGAHSVLREIEGSDLRVHLDTTKDQLKAMPEYIA